MPDFSAPLAMSPRFNSPRYLLKRKLLKLIGSSFYITDANEQLAFYVHQKGFKLKEDIRVYSDESMSQEILVIHARQIMDFSGAYDVFDVTTGQQVGVLKRKGLQSLLRDEWVICDPMDREVATLIEDQMLFALLRRFLSNLIPQDYDVLINGQKAVDIKQNFNPFTYHLNIDFTVATGPRLDPRLGIAAAILLAAIEGRQG
jgi:uncharacterized protein YxjI